MDECVNLQTSWIFVMFGALSVFLLTYKLKKEKP